MKNLIRFLLAATACASVASAQSSGKPYGTRDSKTCTARKEPTKGAPSAAQAVLYFICTTERLFGDKLVLVENVKIEVGNGRRFLRSDSELPEVDPQYPIFPIRGSFDSYFCTRLVDLLQQGSPNCILSRPRNAEGVCYRTSFGDWKCDMTNNTSYRDSVNVHGPR